MTNSWTRDLKNYQIIMLGSGGHAAVLYDSLSIGGIEVAGYMQPTKVIGGIFADLPYLGDDGNLSALDKDTTLLVNGLGSIPGNAQARRRVFRDGKAFGLEFLSVLHASAIVSSSTSLGEGAQVMAGAVLQPGVELGANVIVNTRASIDHDCSVGDHVHIAPGAVLSGEVKVGAASHIGTGAVIVQGVTVGERSLIGAGAIVAQDVPDGATVYPSRPTIKESDGS